MVKKKDRITKKPDFISKNETARQNPLGAGIKSNEIRPRKEKQRQSFPRGYGRREKESSEKGVTSRYVASSPEEGGMRWGKSSASSSRRSEDFEEKL